MKSPRNTDETSHCSQRGPRPIQIQHTTCVGHCQVRVESVSIACLGYIGGMSGVPRPPCDTRCTLSGAASPRPGPHLCGLARTFALSNHVSSAVGMHILSSQKVRNSGYVMPGPWSSLEVNWLPMGSGRGTGHVTFGAPHPPNSYPRGCRISILVHELAAINRTCTSAYILARRTFWPGEHFGSAYGRLRQPCIAGRVCRRTSGWPNQLSKCAA